jgi:aldehyde:ferredoxin oxidoreductase
MAGARLPRERLQEMIQAYYAARGWDRDGQVLPELRSKLGLTDLVFDSSACEENSK